jgi:hypothetical protein
MSRASHIAIYAKAMPTSVSFRGDETDAATRSSKPGNFFFFREQESLTGKVRGIGAGRPRSEIPKSTEKMRTGDRAGRGHVSCCLK